MMTEKMTFETFKARIIEKHDTRVIFDEHGQYGWTSLGMNENGPTLTPGSDGPHWCDVAACPREQTLLGSYDFNTGTAKFFR